MAYFLIFESVRDQAITNPGIALLLDLYNDQKGCVNQSREFEICRGVKQGDSLSSLLFNAALEGAFRRWKRRIGEAGWRIRMSFERLTNTRYADDILVYAKSLEELMIMMELLGEELAAIGFAMHELKTKILTTSINPRFHSVEIGGMMI